jgi:hypothetical protein
MGAFKLKTRSKVTLEHKQLNRTILFLAIIIPP